MSRTINLHSSSTILRVTVFGIAALACSVLGLRLAAQEPVFRSRTEIARLDVRITDDRGKPVTDVRPDEIEVTENGRIRPVLLFRHLNDEHGLAPVENPLDDLTTNASPTPGHVFVLVFDQLHITPGREQRARAAAEQFIQQELKPGDALAVYGLPGPGPLVQLTTDFARARAALLGIRGEAGRAAGGLQQRSDGYQFERGDEIIDVGGRRPEATPVRGMGMNVPSSPDLGLVGSNEVNTVAAGEADQMVAQGDTEVNIFLSYFASVLKRMRWIEGRKNVVLFSEGFYGGNLAPRIEQVASAAAESYSVIYPIDLNTSAVGAEHGAARPATLSAASERRDPLAALALETNGRLVINSNARTIHDTLSGIAAEAEDYYLVGFEPSMPASPKAAKPYHRVEIRVKRSGVRVHARTGYSTPPETSLAQTRQAITAALWSPKVSRGVALEYSTYERSGPNVDRPRVILSAQAQVPVPREAETVDAVFVVRDATSGQAVASGTDHLSVRASTAAGPGELVDVPYRVQFDVPPGDYWMRVLVRDPGGVMGTADRRFHVWSLTGPGLTTSDLIITRLDGSRFDPPARAVVHQDDPVLAYLEIYGAPSAVAAAEAKVEILRPDTDDVLTTAKLELTTGSHGERIVRARLPVDKLPAGEYAARVRVMAASQPARTLVRMFRLLPPNMSATQ